MTLPTFFREIEARVRRAREEGSPRLLRREDFGGTNVTPVTVRLEAGQKAYALPLNEAFANGARNSHVLIATSAPTITARIAPNNTHPDCIDTGLIAAVDAGVFSQVQDGLTTPSFEVEKWVNHEAGSAAGYQHLKAEEVASSFWTHDMLESDSDGDTTSVLRHIWGADDYKNMGHEDDGKEFWFWCREVFSPTNAELRMYSRPYKVELSIDDAYDGTTGTPNDVNMVANGVLGGSYIAQYASKLVVNSWALVRLQKRDFTSVPSGGTARWDAVTMLDHHHFYPGSSYFLPKFGGLWFGDPPWSKIKSVALMPWNMPSGKGAVLSLDAPSDRDVTVEVLAMSIPEPAP